MRALHSQLDPAKERVYRATAELHGQVYADRLLNVWQAEEPSEGATHPSYRAATSLLEPYCQALGAAYPTLHLLARWSVENATPDDPAPHLMTTYWTLEEALGQSERNIRRHLIEDGHPWSETVRSLIDIRHNYGTMLDGKDELGRDKTKGVYVATVIRFFPKGRLSPNARVKRWGSRDLIAESDEGRTRNTRPDALVEKRRYKRQRPLMSDHSSINEQSREFNWLMVKLGQTVSPRVAEKDNPGNLYADIPTSYVLHALREDLSLALEQAQMRGSNIKRARSLWVDIAAKVLAERFGDNKPSSKYEHPDHVTHHDGFTDLWRKALWTALRAELYGRTEHGWNLLSRMIGLAQDARAAPIDKPIAWAWATVKSEGFAELLRDYDTGAVGTLSA